MIRRITTYCILLIVSLVMVGCYPHREVGFLQTRKGLPTYEPQEYKPYRLHRNDEVIYRLVTMDETISKVMDQNQGSSSGQNTIGYRIHADGTVDLPFLKPVPIVGLTLKEAQKRIQDSMRVVIPDAEVRLALNNKTFSVLGDIGAGQYEVYKDKLTIFQALAMTGDVDIRGNRKKVRIIRPVDNQEPIVLEFDIRTNSIIGSEYYYIYPNDLIYVERSKGSFFKMDSYTGFLGLITSSVNLFISILNYTTLINQ